jgi:hypothetical protein
MPTTFTMFLSFVGDQYTAGTRSTSARASVRLRTPTTTGVPSRRGTNRSFSSPSSRTV